MECGETWRADQASPSGRTFSFLPYVPSLWLLAWPALPCSAHARPVWPPIRKPWLCVWCGSAVKAQGGRKRSGLPQFWLLLSLFLGEEGRSSSTSLLVQIKPPASAVMPFAVLCLRRIAHKQPHNAKVSTHKALLLAAPCFLLSDFETAPRSLAGASSLPFLPSLLPSICPPLYSTIYNTETRRQGQQREQRSPDTIYSYSPSTRTAA
jgi:hypothetical protein